jgi:hypothetical protein
MPLIKTHCNFSILLHSFTLWAKQIYATGYAKLWAGELLALYMPT